jgi:hypothetical protein
MELEFNGSGMPDVFARPRSRRRTSIPTLMASMGEQFWTGAPARDRVRGSRRLGDRFAGPAGELLTQVLDHFPLARNKLQRLGHVLADCAILNHRKGKLTALHI